MTMLHLGPKVSTLFSCIWCKSGNHMWGPNTPLFYPIWSFILNCPTFTLKIIHILEKRFYTLTGYRLTFVFYKGLYSMIECKNPNQNVRGIMICMNSICYYGELGSMVSP